MGCGPGLALPLAKVDAAIGPDHATPPTLAPTGDLVAGARPSAARAPYSASTPVSATAAIVQSGEIALGPSSGPSLSGNGCNTPASALSQYQAPVPKARTASRPESPGTAPSVKNAACAGGLARVLRAPAVCVRSSASTSYVAQQPTVSPREWELATSPIGPPLCASRAAATASILPANGSTRKSES